MSRFRPCAVLVALLIASAPVRAAESAAPPSAGSPGDDGTIRVPRLDMEPAASASDTRQAAPKDTAETIGQTEPEAPEAGRPPEPEAQPVDALPLPAPLQGAGAPEYTTEKGIGATATALHALGIGAAALALYVAARARGDARRAARAAAHGPAVADRPAHAVDRPASTVGESAEMSEERMPQAHRSPPVDGPRADTAEEALADRSVPDLTLNAQRTEGGEALIVRNSAQQTVRLHKVSYGYADPETGVAQTAAVTPNWDLAPGDSSRVLMGSKAVQAGRASPPDARYLEGCLEVQDHRDREFRIPFRYDLDEMRVTQGAPAEGWL